MKAGFKIHWATAGTCWNFGIAGSRTGARLDTLPNREAVEAKRDECLLLPFIFGHKIMCYVPVSNDRPAP